MAEVNTQRRLAAILSADVVGYSRMMGEDEVGTHLALKTLRREMIEPKADRYNGRTVKLMGDGALMEFTSVVDAMQFAVEVQQAMRERNRDIPERQRIEYRMGINLGDIIVDGNDVYGDGVNVAARLEALAEPGGICVRRNVRDEVRDKLDVAFKDLGEVEVKNIARPVRCFAVVLGPTADVQREASSVQDATLALPDKPSIAVLPFQNMSQDPEQEFFADGMSEDIITGLSRYRSLFVIARNSTFAYKGQSPDLRAVSQDLGVRYVLEGSIRKAGQRIRVTAQLIEGASGAHIWAERYDRELTDLFAVQDEITEAIVAAIGPEIDQVKRDRTQRLAPDNLDSWESYQRGLWHLYHFTEADNAEAQRLFRLASARSPTFAPAHSGLTHALYFAYMHGYPKDRSAALAEAFESGRRAVACDDRDADAHFALGASCISGAISRPRSGSWKSRSVTTPTSHTPIWDLARRCYGQASGNAPSRASTAPRA